MADRGAQAAQNIPIIPAKAGIQDHNLMPCGKLPWVPAFAGTSGEGFARMRLIMDARVKFTTGPAVGRTRLPAHDDGVCGPRLPFTPLIPAKAGIQDHIAAPRYIRPGSPLSRG